MKTIREIMRPSFIFRLHTTSLVSDAVHAMTAYNIGIVAVMDDDDRLAGVLSERDVVQRVVARGLDPSGTTVGQVMTRDVVLGDVDEECGSAMRKMDGANVRHLPIVSNGQVVSMLSIRDLMRVAIAESETENEHLRAYICQTPRTALVAAPQYK